MNCPYCAYILDLEAKCRNPLCHNYERPEKKMVNKIAVCIVPGCVKKPAFEGGEYCSKHLQSHPVTCRCVVCEEERREMRTPPKSLTPKVHYHDCTCDKCADLRKLTQERASYDLGVADGKRTIQGNHKPPRGRWAAGFYMCKCSDCGREYEGDKRSTQCSNCAYSQVPPQTIQNNGGAEIVYRRGPFYGKSRLAGRASPLEDMFTPVEPACSGCGGSGWLEHPCQADPTAPYQPCQLCARGRHNALTLVPREYLKPYQPKEKKMSDPWKHRSEGMCCKTCMWNVAKERTGPMSVEEESAMVPPTPALGRCRRHAPTMNGYPVVFPNDWCGDHKLDENKILPEQGSASAKGRDV